MKTVLITGSSRGIGRAAAALFAKKGYNTVINYNKSKERAEELCSELSLQGCLVMAIKADVSDYEETNKMFDAIGRRFGGVDILVNNAAVAEQKLVIDMTPSDWKRIIDINLNGYFNTARLALPHMIEKKHGKMVNISSVWGIRGASMEAHYSASKAGVIGLTKSLAKEYALSGIQVNCIAPGVIDTEMNGIFDREEILSIIDLIPAGRMGRPEEVAELIFFLASDKADYITGQVIEIGGGFE